MATQNKKANRPNWLSFFPSRFRIKILKLVIWIDVWMRILRENCPGSSRIFSRTKWINLSLHSFKMHETYAWDEDWWRQDLGSFLFPVPVHVDGLGATTELCMWFGLSTREIVRIFFLTCFLFELLWLYFEISLSSSWKRVAVVKLRTHSISFL